MRWPAIAAAAALALGSQACRKNVDLGRIGAEIAKHLDYFERRVASLLPRIPEEKLGWRPALGVRSVREAALHIAAVNFLVARMAGEPPPPGIDPDALERAPEDRARIVDLARRSFASLRAALEKAGDEGLDRAIDYHGKRIPLREAVLKTAMHASEHLGQLVAYARMVGVPRAP
jgi:uncharacterized damage-inducible protein DinB